VVKIEGEAANDDLSGPEQEIILQTRPKKKNRSKPTIAFAQNPIRRNLKTQQTNKNSTRRRELRTLDNRKCRRGKKSSSDKSKEHSPIIRKNRQPRAKKGGRDPYLHYKGPEINNTIVQK